MNKNQQIITEICETIKSSPQELNLDTLAKQAQLSPAHFQKLFKSETGISPKEYALAQKKNKAIELLNSDKTVTEAIYESGHNSNSRFYEKTADFLGMTPTQYKKGGLSKDIMLAIGQCSLGHILVAQSDKGLCSILLGDNPENLLEEFQGKFPKACIIPGDKSFESNVGKVIAFVDMPQIGLNLSLDIQGTSFQQRVWKALKTIPLGQTASYTDIANAIGMPKAVRAVANACGSNNLAVAIPCHRVVQKNGSLAGYKWGIERKSLLLAKELSKS